MAHHPHLTGTPASHSATTDGLFRHLKADFMASIVVFLVALPLCIGIAVAVGVSPGRALITGIIGGLVVGWVTGSPLQVSGPAAGLFVIVADLLADARSIYLEGHPQALESTVEIHALMALGASVFLAGLLQLLAGQLKLGQWFRSVSPAVIKGMLAGIGILILLSQLHVMLDHKAIWNGEKAHGGLQYLATIPEAIMKCFSADSTANHHLAALIGIVAMACFVIWPKVAPKRVLFLPAALVGILVATLFAEATAFDVIKLNVPANMMTEIQLPTSSWATLFTMPLVLSGAFVIAIVASTESLLCATAVDQMHLGPRTNYDKELKAQGIGNILCGLLGALPMTGVIVRSSANVDSGAKGKLSTIFHGAWLLLFVVAIPFVLTYIPRSALGALLVYTGFKLVNIKDIKLLWKTSRTEAAIYFATVAMIVSTDLLLGVLLGVALSAGNLLLTFSKLDINLETNEDGSKSHLEIQGAATFLSLPKIAAKLEQVPRGSELHMNSVRLSYIDHACLELIATWSRQHVNLGGKSLIDWNQLNARFSTGPAPVIAPTDEQAPKDPVYGKEE